MFVLCPHCQFLVGVDPRTGRPPATCPKCGGALEAESATASEPVAVAADADAPVESPVESPVEAPVEAPVETPAAPEPAPAQLSADAVIAAMAQKAPRKPRSKPARSEEPTKPAPAKRKRAEATETEATATEATPTAPAPAPAPPPAKPAKPATPAKPARPPGPPLSARMSSWLRSLKPTPKPKPAKPTPSPAADPPAERRKATVKPVPSLRERAAERAAKRAAPAHVEAPPSDFIATLAPTPVEAALAAEPTPPAPEPVRAAEPAPIAQAPAQAPAAAPIAAPSRAPRAAAAPSFARRRTGLRGAMPTRWTSFATLGALALLLAVQLLLAQRDALAADARWRPMIATLCTLARCTLPAWNEPDAFTMLSRDVRPHPRAAGTLQIDANFRNDARWAQAWPLLVVSLSDIDGRVLGTRAFTAREYLGDAAATQSTLAPGQTAAIRLAVVEPAPGVVAFSFEFR